MYITITVINPPSCYKLKLLYKTTNVAAAGPEFHAKSTGGPGHFTVPPCVFLLAYELTNQDLIHVNVPGNVFPSRQPTPGI